MVKRGALGIWRAFFFFFPFPFLVVVGHYCVRLAMLRTLNELLDAPDNNAPDN